MILAILQALQLVVALVVGWRLSQRLEAVRATVAGLRSEVARNTSEAERAAKAAEKASVAASVANHWIRSIDARAAEMAGPKGKLRPSSPSYPSRSSDSSMRTAARVSSSDLADPDIEEP